MNTNTTVKRGRMTNEEKKEKILAKVDEIDFSEVMNMTPEQKKAFVEGLLNVKKEKVEISDEMVSSVSKILDYKAMEALSAFDAAPSAATLTAAKPVIWAIAEAMGYKPERGPNTARTPEERAEVAAKSVLSKKFRKTNKVTNERGRLPKELQESWEQFLADNLADATAKELKKQ